MANQHKGEVAFDADGKQYTLRYSIDAICCLETETGKGIVALLSEFQDSDKITLTLARQMMWAGLREHHPEVTVKEAGELIVAAGGLMKFIEVLNNSFAASFGLEEGKKNPRKAGGQNGTGLRSTRPGHRSNARPTTSGNERRAS